MNDIIKIANEIANSTNNETNFTNIQSNLPKTEQQQKDEVVEMIYQKHLQAQEWGNKLNQELETSTHKHRHEKSRNKRWDWFNNAWDTYARNQAETQRATFNGNVQIGQEISNRMSNAWDTYAQNQAETQRATFNGNVQNANTIVKKCINDKGVLVDMIVYGAVGTGAGMATGGPFGAVIEGSAGIVAPCASTIIKHEFNINDRRKRNIESNENKWTNEFTKSISHEQHLPIDNKTNFVTNNITSL